MRSRSREPFPSPARGEASRRAIARNLIGRDSSRAMTMTLNPKALPVARILALLPILALLAFVDMGLPHWLGLADATKLTENWMQVHRFLSAVWWLVLGLFLFLVLEVVIWRA